MDKIKFRIIYFIGLAITAVLMIIFIAFNALSFTFLIFFWVLKFLSGFGLILSITNGFTFILDKLKDKLDKTQVNLLILFEIIIPILFIIYSIYKIFSSIDNSAFSSEVGLILVFDTLIFIYGIVSLLLNLYIIQLIREQFQDAVTKKRRIKSGAKKVSRKIKKKYFGWRKEYAKAQIQDQKTFTEMLELWRNKLAIYLLIPIAIGALIFTPIAFICIMFWLKIFILDEDIETFEKICLLCSMIAIGVIACLAPFINFPFFADIATYLWTMNIFFMIGITLATIFFVRRILKLKGINFESIMDKIQDMKEEKKEEIK
ncbi:MAG: hypothetical protein KGD57_05240 [Candidatus Lokiarchaeota archaeon]|nr:hypothetical protein [Candidatus Lokiarchaeota archaeon]